MDTIRGTQFKDLDNSRDTIRGNGHNSNLIQNDPCDSVDYELVLLSHFVYVFYSIQLGYAGNCQQHTQKMVERIAKLYSCTYTPLSSELKHTWRKINSKRSHAHNVITFAQCKHTVLHYLVLFIISCSFPYYETVSLSSSLPKKCVIRLIPLKEFYLFSCYLRNPVTFNYMEVVK